MAKKAARKEDTSPYIHQSKKIPLTFKISDRIPWTDRQLEFFRIMQDKDTKLMFLTGPAGTGKSIMAVYCALNALLDKRVSDIVYVRSIVESTANKMGFLPGSIAEKTGPYSDVCYQKVEELVAPEAKNALISGGLVNAIPIGFLRGYHFAVKYIIGDECQSFDTKELTTLMTRIGEKSKVILCGDPMQSDLPPGKSGFVKFMNAFDTEEARSHGIHVFKLGKEDIVRSELLKYIVEVIEKM
jgi:phosphate starvation-inducible protein PhoH and related proteins